MPSNTSITGTRVLKVSLDAIETLNGTYVSPDFDAGSY